MGLSEHSLGALTSIPCSSFSAKAGIEQPRDVISEQAWLCIPPDSMAGVQSYGTTDELNGTALALLLPTV